MRREGLHDDYIIHKEEPRIHKAHIQLYLKAFLIFQGCVWKGVLQYPYLLRSGDVRGGEGEGGGGHRGCRTEGTLRGER